MVRQPDAAGRLRWFATPLLLALVLVAAADMALPLPDRELVHAGNRHATEVDRAGVRLR